MIPISATVFAGRRIEHASLGPSSVRASAANPAWHEIAWRRQASLYSHRPAPAIRMLNIFSTVREPIRCGVDWTW